MQLKEFGVSLGDLIHEFNFEVVYGPEGFEKTEITKDDVEVEFMDQIPQADAELF